MKKSVKSKTNKLKKTSKKNTTNKIYKKSDFNSGDGIKPLFGDLVCGIIYIL